MEMAHAAPGCVTTARTSFKTMVPSRGVAFGFAATLNRTSPLPCPDVGVTPVIHGASEVADHAHSGCVLTVTAPAPPEDPIAPCFSANETWHLRAVGEVVVSDSLQPIAAVAPIAIASRIDTR